MPFPSFQFLLGSLGTVEVVERPPVMELFQFLLGSLGTWTR